MKIIKDPLLDQLNDPSLAQRLQAARIVGQQIRDGERAAIRNREVNNHVHTRFSFSPYFPTMAAYMAWEAGLQTVGCIDHDSISGGQEMNDAAACFGIGSTIGFELRVNFDGTSMQGRKLNNPSSANIAYVVAHGVPKRQIERVRRFLEPICASRTLRNRRMLAAMNGQLAKSGVETLDFDRDVYAISQANEGGSITERHLLYALCCKVMAHTGKGRALVDFVEEYLKVAIPPAIKALLMDPENPHYVYDLLGILKSSFLDAVFIQPNYNECISVDEFIEFSLSVNAIPAYAYLGDVINSATGDKKDEAFEDAFLDELMPEIKQLGFQAVTYMPPRNSVEQLRRLQKLCRKYELMEISGVDINSSRQTFNCPIITDPDFIHLTTSTWALIAHEKLTDKDPKLGLFHPENPLHDRSLEARIKRYAELGQAMDCFNPDTIFSMKAAI